MPQISVIVPVYKVEPYLRRCVDSILSQTFTDFELILVDDGSPDNCGAICDEYASLHNNVKVIHQKNAGAAAARNVGIENVKGDYILFCDADDYYDSDVLSGFLQYAIEQNDPMILYCFDFYNMWQGVIDYKKHYKQGFADISASEEKLKFISSNSSHILVGYSLWNKLYSQKIIERYHLRLFERDILNNKDDWAEDLFFNLQYFSVIKAIKMTGEAAYFLTEHVKKGCENDDVLAGRTVHMLKMFEKLSQSSIFCDDEELRQKFWQVFIWHMRRFLYADVRVSGITSLRDVCIDNDKSGLFFNCVEAALKKWSGISKNWSKRDAKDYRYLLNYIKTGNLLLYKLRNYWLWRVTPLINKVIGKK